VTWQGKTIFIGSGAFGIPTLTALLACATVPLVISQPPRPAGRGRAEQPTPVDLFARERGLEVITPQRISEPQVLQRVQHEQPDALVVIAYGGKLPPELLEGTFAINLHASLLPRWRGAAPIHRAMIAADPVSGISVIALASVMDAGVVYARRETPIDPMETAGELHDRLAELGPEAVLRVLADHAQGTLEGETQDESQVTHARKLRKEEGTTEFGGAAEMVAARIHGLTPWPGCTVDLNGKALRLLRVRVTEESDAPQPGAIDAAGRVRCGKRAVELLQVQPAGGRAMSFAEFARGHRLPPDALLLPWHRPGGPGGPEGPGAKGS